MNEFCLYVRLCTTSMPGTFGDQERTLDLLKLELQVTCDLHVGVGGSNPVPLEGQPVLSSAQPLNLHS